MNRLEELKPETLWRFFWEISQIPRASGKEEQIRNYVISTARSFDCAVDTDTSGNVIVKKEGRKEARTVALQAHLDMVCEKNTGTVHDFDEDPISLVRRGDWVMAEGTTLGADNGIGVAAMLALMADSAHRLPPLELLFTVDEETGMTGARHLGRESFTAELLINLDSEEMGTFTIGCAGGLDSRLILDLNLVDPWDNTLTVCISVTGLAGGHSGVNIHEDRGNAIKFLVRFLKTAGSTIPFQLVRLSGGSKHNAIPREAEALILLNPDLFGEMEAACRGMTTLLRDEYSQREEALSIQAFREDTEPVRVIAAPDAARYLDLLTAIPHGALRIGPGREGAVISSTNLAICTQEDSSCTIVTSHRSIIPSAINEIASQVKAVGTLAGAEVIHEHGYPAWMPDYNSELLMRCSELYRTRHGENPRIRVIHAGLECSYFKEHFTELDMISFGPRIMHAHSPSEMVEISSVGSMWDFLTALLEHLAESRPA